VRVLKGCDEVRKSLPQIVNIFCSLGKIIGEFNFGVAQLAHLVNGELETILVFINQALDLEEIVLLESIENFLHVIPHLGFELNRCGRQG